jgi:hypothetical protein
MPEDTTHTRKSIAAKLLLTAALLTVAAAPVAASTAPEPTEEQPNDVHPPVVESGATENVEVCVVGNTPVGSVEVCVTLPDPPEDGTVECTPVSCNDP